jgi:hypothetical protein
MTSTERLAATATEEKVGRYKTLGAEIGSMVDAKNYAYGSSFDNSGGILMILYPDGVKPHQYADMLAVVRIIDKLFRVANRKDAFGESPARDIAGYGLLMAHRHTEEDRPEK